MMRQPASSLVDEDRIETEDAFSQLLPDGKILTRFGSRGSRLFLRDATGVWRRPLEQATWSYDNETGRVRFEFMERFIHLIPFFWTNSGALLFSDLTAQQRQALDIRPILQHFENRELKFGFDFIRRQGVNGFGIAIDQDRNVDYEVHTRRDHEGNLIDLVLRFPGNIRMSFADMLEAFPGAQLFRQSGYEGIVVTSFSALNGERVTVDPSTSIDGDVADDAINFDGPSTYALQGVSLGTITYHIHETLDREWRSCYTFNTGSVIPAGSTVDAATLRIFFRIVSADFPDEVIEFRTSVRTSKDYQGFGGTVEATSGDFNSMNNVGDEDQVFVRTSPTTNHYENIVLTKLGNIATAGDIESPPNPDRAGFTNVMLTDASLTSAGYGRIFQITDTANGSASRKPILDVTWTPPSTPVFDGFLNRVNDLNPFVQGTMR
jgi:hypothetical protein